LQKYRKRTNKTIVIFIQRLKIFQQLTPIQNKTTLGVKNLILDIGYRTIK